eukprot:CAMPEP_0198111274 /NCGR_PEP_ID=MMETSP1442-20131203/3249_1 /TAXON_ID= /ORGANISM="Craspedostauros australis, Strain CCMP3328" /LENGTH=437 /DNA_ID=CAMNT_0043767651 /DNA_START=376 /DNA_END=1690 /DNA_ORIENTATION=+
MLPLDIAMDRRYILHHQPPSDVMHASRRWLLPWPNRALRDDAKYRVPTLDELEQMSNEDLEKICLDRGFELVAEDDGGDAGSCPINGPDCEPILTHEDYVEAAQRCLQIEREMNEVLEEHPELVLELEDEIQRMKEEKERLEQENRLRKKQINDLKLQIEEQAAAAVLEKDGRDAGGGSGAGFAGIGSESEVASKKPPTSDAAGADVQSNEAEEPTGAVPSGDGIASEDPMNVAGDDERDNPIPTDPAASDVQCVGDQPQSTATNTDIDEGNGDGGDLSSSGSAGEAQDETAAASTPTAETENDMPEEPQQTDEAVVAVNDEPHIDEFSLRAFYDEFIQTISSNTRREIKILLKILLPIARPILNAGDLVWRQVKLAVQMIERHVDYLRRMLEASSGGGSGSNGDGDTECDDDGDVVGVDGSVTGDGSNGGAERMTT